MGKGKHTHTRSLTGTLTYDATRSYTFSIHARLLLLLLFTNIFILLFWLAKVTRLRYSRYYFISSYAASPHRLRLHLVLILFDFVVFQLWSFICVRDGMIFSVAKNHCVVHHIRTNLVLMMATTHAHRRRHPWRAFDLFIWDYYY